MDFLFGTGLPYTRKQEIIHGVYNSYRTGCNATRALRESSKYADGIIRQERHQLYLRGINLNAVILDIRATKSGNNKLWLNISGAGVNTLTIRNMDKFVKNYGTLHINQRIIVKVVPYRNSYTYRIKYNDKSKSLKGKKSLNIKSKKAYGGKKLINPEKEVQFEMDDYNRLQSAFEESAKGISLYETAIVSEDKSSFERGINYLKNAVQIIKNININRIGYGREHRVFQEEKIARGNFSISTARWEWAKNVELANVSRADKNKIYKKIAEVALEHSKICKNFSEKLLQEADILGHKNMMYLYFFNLASAHKLFYLNNSKKEDIELAKKYSQKAIDINRTLPIENRLLDEDTMNSIQESLSQIPASKELTDTFLSIL